MFSKTYVVSEICLCLNGDRSQLHTALDKFADQVIATSGQMDKICEITPDILRIVADHQPFFHSVCNYGEVYRNEGDAENALNQMYEATSSKYAAIPQVGASDIHTGWFVITFSFCFESATPNPAIETEIRSIEETIDALNQLSIIANQKALRSFNIQWSPAEPEDNLSEDQVIEYYPDLIHI